MGGFEGLVSERHVQLLLAFIRHLKARTKEHIQITNQDRYGIYYADTFRRKHLWVNASKVSQAR